MLWLAVNESIGNCYPMSQWQPVSNNNKKLPIFLVTHSLDRHQTAWVIYQKICLKQVKVVALQVCLANYPQGQVEIGSIERDVHWEQDMEQETSRWVTIDIRWCLWCININRIDSTLYNVVFRYLNKQQKTAKTNACQSSSSRSPVT